MCGIPLSINVLTYFIMVFGEGFPCYWEDLVVKVTKNICNMSSKKTLMKF